MGFPILVRWYLYIESGPLVSAPLLTGSFFTAMTPHGCTRKNCHWCSLGPTLILVFQCVYTFLESWLYVFFFICNHYYSLSDTADTVKCHSCGGALMDWAREDDPWVEHARWYPKCSFVRQVKGVEFVNASIERSQVSSRPIFIAIYMYFAPFLYARL